MNMSNFNDLQELHALAVLNNELVENHVEHKIIEHAEKLIVENDDLLFELPEGKDADEIQLENNILIGIVSFYKLNQVK